MHAEAEAEAVQLDSIEDHPMLVTDRPEIIEDAEGLESITAHVREVGSFAYDTEFIGEETFLPRICLVQIATAERLALIDPVKVPDLSPIFGAVADRDVVTLVHDGAQDLEPVRRLLDRDPEGIVDTQVCAAFLDMPWPSSLAKLVDRFAGHRLSKGHTFTDWDARPLTDRQVRYAADDVRFLPLAWSRMKPALEKTRRFEWAMRECEESRRRHVGRFDPEKQVRRIVRGSRVKPRTSTALFALVELRHEMARELDLPHRVAISDEGLNELAKTQPESPEAVAACRNIGKRTASEFGQKIIETIKSAMEGPSRTLTGNKTKDETAEDRMRIDALWSALSLRCLADGIAPSILTSRSDLGAWYMSIANDGSDKSLFPHESWRHDAAGAWLDEFIAGGAELALRWNTGRLEREQD